MEKERADVTIEESARACRQSFDECLLHSDKLSPKQLYSIEDQLGRFSIWAFNSGALASYRASLDYHLRGVADVQRLVRRLLQTLEENIQQCESNLFLRYAGPMCFW
jgi:hypothetical protein